MRGDYIFNRFGPQQHMHVGRDTACQPHRRWPRPQRASSSEPARMGVMSISYLDTQDLQIKGSG